MTLEEALQMIYTDEADVDQVFMEPPDSNTLTDEDSGDEDESGLVDNLSRNQLCAKAEVRLTNNQLLPGFDGLDNDSSNEENSVDYSQSASDTENHIQNTDNSDIRQFQRPGSNGITWINGDIIPAAKQFPKPDYSKYEQMSFVEIFEKFIDNEIIEFLVEQSTKYALFLNNPDPQISAEEMKCAIAILILTGYNQLPGRDFYWESQNDVKNIMVSDAMRRDRFRQILRYLHCADNTKPDPNDKLWKVRPLMDKLKNRFIENWVAEEHLDFDESLIKYFGRHSCKQFIRGKPIRFGYKMWCLNTSSGYLVNFDMYQGQNPRGNKSYEREFGKCAAPLINMVDELPDNMKHLPFKFYFDNLFTGFNILFYLKNTGFDSTGTIRDNRIPKNCPLPQKKVFVKSKMRGEFISSIDREDGIILVKWMDNNAVTTASTCHGVAPLSMVNRYSQKDKKIVQVQRPSIITEYSRFMGGTDLMDENLSRYRISVRRKKWWWSIFTWLLDVAIVNAWCLNRYAKGKTSCSQLEFRRAIVQTYLSTYKVLPKGLGRPSISKSSITLNRVSDNLRYDGRDHLLVPTQNKKRKRCAGEGCSSSVRSMCSKCDVGLCLECNFIFHKK